MFVHFYLISLRPSCALFSARDLCIAYLVSQCNKCMYLSFPKQFYSFPSFKRSAHTPTLITFSSYVCVRVWVRLCVYNVHFTSSWRNNLIDFGLAWFECLPFSCRPVVIVYKRARAPKSNILGCRRRKQQQKKKEKISTLNGESGAHSLYISHLFCIFLFLCLSVCCC